MSVCVFEGFVSIRECLSIHNLQQSISGFSIQSIDLSSVVPTSTVWCDVKAKQRGDKWREGREGHTEVKRRKTYIRNNNSTETLTIHGMR